MRSLLRRIQMAFFYTDTKTENIIIIIIIIIIVAVQKI